MRYLILALLLAGCITEPEHQGKTIVIDCRGQADSSLYSDSTGITRVYKACEFPEVKPPAPK